MADPVDRIMGGAVGGMEDETLVLGRSVLKGEREALWSDANENREQLHLPPLEQPEYPGSPTLGGSIAKNFLGLFGGQGQTRTPFTESYTPDVTKRFLIEKGHYTEEEAEEYVSRLTFYQLMGLRHTSPGAWAADPRTAIQDPEQVAEAKRAFMGIEEAQAGVELSQGEMYVPPSVMEEAELAGESITAPYAPKGPHNVAPGTAAIDPVSGKVIYRNPREDELPKDNYYDTWGEKNSETGQYPLVHGTEAQMLADMRKDKGRYLKEETQVHERTGALLAPTVKKNVEDETWKLMKLRDQLKHIESNFDPNWLTLSGKISQKLLKIGSWLGALDDQQRFELFAMGSGTAAIAQVTNDMIRLMTGAQMSKNEADRLMIQEINKDDTPDEMIAKLMRSSYFNDLALARNRLVLENGVLDAEELTRTAGWEKHVTIESSRQEMLKRAQAMYDKIGVDTGEVLTNYEAQQRVRTQFEKEHGFDPVTLTDKWVGKNLGPETLGQMKSLDTTAAPISPPAEVQ